MLAFHDFTPSILVQTTVTRCLCEQMDFERTCGIQCANLEAFGLPLNRELLWIDFRFEKQCGVDWS